MIAYYTLQVVQMLFSVLIGFMVCAIPFQISTLYDHYRPRTNTAEDKVGNSLLWNTIFSSCTSDQLGQYTSLSESKTPRLVFEG